MNFKRGMFHSQSNQKTWDKATKYSKKQFTVLNTSMLVASIGFMSIFLIGFLIRYLISNEIIGVVSVSTMIVFANIGIIVGTILSFVWCFRVYKASTFFALFTIILYCLSYGVGFGFLFYLLGYQDIMVAFLTVGLIFFGTFLISRVMSFKIAMKLGHIIFIASFVGMFVFLAMFLIGFFTPIFSFGNGIVYYVTIGLSGVLSILFLVYELWLAQNADKFISDSELSLKLGMFFGFQILVNLIQILFIIIRFLLLSRR